MRFESNATDGQDNLPTFFQWCKANIGKTVKQKHVVTKIWLPNKFPDLTVETELFRLRISHKAPVFSAVRESVQQFVDNNLVLAISEVDLETYDYTLEVMDGETGYWVELGTSGWKCEVAKRSSKRRSKKAE